MDKRNELIVIIKPNGNFEVDINDKKGKSTVEDLKSYEDLLKSFQNDKYKTLFLLGLEGYDGDPSISFKYLLESCLIFIKELSRDTAVEFLREKAAIKIDKAKINALIDQAPYMIGGEHLTTEWFQKFFNGLNEFFARSIATYDGSVKDYFEKYNSNIHLVGRIFFHLVESKDDYMPFAFLATYSSFVSSSGQAKHLPLKNALVEYKNDQKK